MKRRFISIVMATFLTACWTNSSQNQAEKLGNREFTPESWANASQIERGQMTSSFLRKYNPTSLHRTDVEKILGKPTGYYYYDNNPAYFVGPDSVTNVHGRGYLFVFEANKNDGHIERVLFVPEVE